MISKSASAGGPAGSDDAHAALKQLADELREATMQVAWRQWRALGAGAAERTGENAGRRKRGVAGEAHKIPALIDPEALVLVSLVLVRDELRLADLLHDWAAHNSDLLSVQRLKNLLAEYSDELQTAILPQLIWFATVARDTGKDLRWRAAIDLWTKRSQPERGGVVDPIAVREQPAEDLRGATHIAPRRKKANEQLAKSRATRARPAAGASLLLRLRLGFGVGAKADVLGFLLAHSDELLTVREISRATVYTPVAIRRAAEDMAAARFIHASAGQPVRYRISFSEWESLLQLGPQPPRWGSWQERFVFVSDFLHWANAARERPLSQYALGAHGRDLLEQHRPAFDHDRVAVWSAYSEVSDWTKFLSRAVRSLIGTMESVA